MNLMTLLEMAASADGERTALQCGAERWSVARLMAAARAGAAVFRESGAARVALLDESSPALPAALFGASWAGLPFAPLNYRLAAGELDALLERLAPVLLVTDESRVAGLAGRPGIQALSRAAFLRSLASGSQASAQLRGADSDSDWVSDPERIALLLFTSGTTGPPKAAVLRQRHLVSYILAVADFASAEPDAATLLSVPPYHIAGIAGLLTALYAGRRIVQLPAFRAEDWLATARAESVTHAFLVPTMLARIVETLGDASDPGLPALRALAYGGGRMPMPILERALKLLPHTDFTNAYGLTETSSTLCLLGPAEHRAALASERPEQRRRLASVGRPLPGLELEIRDPEGVRLGAGLPGEIFVRGEQVSGEYLGHASRLDAEGWFGTRDSGWLDAEGYLFLEGRVDDVIVRGGENLSPGEIEDVLLAHAAVADAGVLGVPDLQWGEAVAAAVVLRPGADASADELGAWVREHLRSSRVPEHWSFPASLPYTETGKLLRRELLASFAVVDGT